MKLSAVEREIDNIFSEISSLMTENIKFTTFYFHINLCMQCSIWLTAVETNLWTC